MKLTVKEYATQLDVSIQSVYKKIKRGTLNTVKENNTIYVIVDNIEDKRVDRKVQSNQYIELMDILRRRDKEVKRLHKEVKRLTKKLENCENNKSKVYLSYISELKQLQLSPPTNNKVDTDIIDIKKKKKSKNKRNKK